MRAPAAADLRRLLHPASVAVVGGETAAEVIRQCRKIGYAGPIWPVNQRRTHIEGIACFAGIADLPAPPDAAFVAVPREETIGVVRALAARGAGGAICYASGFAEVDAQGAALQQQLVAAAGGMALLGPNCYGIINYLDGCALWPDHFGGGRVTRGVAILTQSGNIALNLSMQRHHLPIAYLMAIGNKAVSDIHDCMAAVLDDPRVSAIGLHLEGLGDVAAFSAVARAALARGVGIVVLKAGASEIGAQLTASHTRSLAGADALYAALFAQLGVARVADLGEFLETLKLLHACGPLDGLRVGSLSCSGGDAALVADLGQVQGLQFPALAPTVAQALAQTLGPRVPLNNPLDYQTYIWGDEPALTRCFAAMMDADIDVCVLVLDFPDTGATAIPGWDEVINAFIAAHARRGGAAILVSSMPELLPPHAAARLLAAGIAPLQGLREAVAAIAGAARVGLRRRQIDTVRALAPPVPLRAGAPLLLDEPAAKQALAAFGLHVPPSRRVMDAAGAVEAAEAIGYPVVVKAVAADLAHKTEQGAVRLNLADARAVRAAVDDLAGRFPQFLVEKMLTGGVAELIVGVTRDPQFGQALTVGAGGIFVELLADARTLLLPVTRGEVEAALRGLRCFALLDGYRGRPRAPLADVVEAVMAIAAFAQAHADDLLELDVNPLIAGSEGALAVDALVRLVAPHSAAAGVRSPDATR
jgi:acetyl-CoA synthetase